MWQVEVRHEGLHKYRLIKGKEQYVVLRKAEAQQAVWDAMWQKKLKREEETRAREQRAYTKESKIANARERTADATKAIDSLKTVLRCTLIKNDAIDWESLKDNAPFQKANPQKPTPEVIPDPPNSASLMYEPKLGLFEKLFSSKREIKVNKAKSRFERDYEEWKKKKNELEVRNVELEKMYNEELVKFEKEKQFFLITQQENNAAIAQKKRAYFASEPEAISEYCDLVLSQSEYPDFFPQEFALDYNPLNKILIVEYVLPAIDDLPRVKEVKYVQSKDMYNDVLLSESAIQKLYDSLIYQIALRTIHELFEADVIGAIEAVVFNGWVETVDKATGKEIRPCILSVQARREEFLSINLSNVDPKMCFRNLKGIASSKLYSMTPIAPILNISREDKRFVAPHNVSGEVDESTNLAAMDWEDFEHLIRELFEKEFGDSGGEVKITRASRDSGVDAVAFDPDPIRGGKIVIQAKRYTNTVGVSAVRDLYGTVMNEGATKGILVTTADYGPDAYDFAKGKPLTLLNGSNLLFLLEKHGHKAHIDIKAAKALLREEEKE